jgi:hypothetical protein
MEEIFRRVLEAARAEGGDPPNATFVRTARVIRCALEAADDLSPASRRALEDDAHPSTPSVERYHEVLICLVHSGPPFLEGQGNFGSLYALATRMAPRPTRGTPSVTSARKDCSISSTLPLAESVEPSALPDRIWDCRGPLERRRCDLLKAIVFNPVGQEARPATPAQIASGCDRPTSSPSSCPLSGKISAIYSQALVTSACARNRLLWRISFWHDPAGTGY